MRKLLPVVVLAALIFVFGAWFTLTIRAKRAYESTRTELSAHPYSVVRMDDKMRTFFHEVHTSWVQKHNDVDSEYSIAMESIGLSPCVSNVVYLFTYQMPEYSMFRPSRNKQPATIGMVQALILPSSLDNTIYVSDDDQLAFVRCDTNRVSVFSNDTSGLRHAMYYQRPKNAEQGTTTTPAANEQ